MYYTFYIYISSLFDCYFWKCICNKNSIKRQTIDKLNSTMEGNIDARDTLKAAFLCVGSEKFVFFWCLYAGICMVYAWYIVKLQYKY